MRNSNLSRKEVHCQSCPLSDGCIAATLAANEVELLDKIVCHPKPVKKAETLFYAGEELTYLYAIRKGSIKTFNISRDGEEQITGFHQAGEMIGMDALANKRHKSFGKALEETEYCAIPYKALYELGKKVPQVQQNLMNFMSNEISKQYDLMLTLNQRSADQRLAAFLLNVYSQNNSTPSNMPFNETTIHLNMTRGEIGNYLGLALETVSRLINRFKKQDLIEINKRKVNILDFPGLSEVASIDLAERMAA